MVDRSISDESFLGEVSRILGALGEIVCVFRFSHAAGNRSYEIFPDLASLLARLQDLPPRTSVIVFRERQLQIRGISNDELITKAMHSIPDGVDWTIVRTSLITMGSQSWYHCYDGRTHGELEDELRDEYCWGHPVAVGIEPDWHNLDATIEAIVPGTDGRVEQGVY